MPKPKALKRHEERRTTNLRADLHEALTRYVETDQRPIQFHCDKAVEQYLKRKNVFQHAQPDQITTD